MSIISKLAMNIMFRPMFGHVEATDQKFDHQIIQGRDGSRLEVAWQWTKADTPKGVVLVCHPWLKYGMHYAIKQKYADGLSNSPYHLVYFNFKGFGKSTVNSIAFSEDIISMAEHIKSTASELPLYLFGLSMGGYHGLHAVSRHPHLFNGVILDSVPMSIDRFFSKGILGYFMRILSKSSLASVTTTGPMLSAYEKTKDMPVLLFLGDQDPYISATEIEQIIMASPAINLRIVEGADHLRCHKAQREFYDQEIINHLNLLTT